MAYSTNPHLPRLRRDAIQLVRKGWGIRQVARLTGFHQSHRALGATCEVPPRGHTIRTQRSRPHHPRQLSPDMTERILAYRRQHRRCAQVCTTS